MIVDFFDEFEKEILEAAHNVMKNRQGTLDAITKNSLTEKGLGIEGWFTIELLVDDKFQQWGIKKVQSPADLIIKEKKVELKGLSDTDFTWITDWWDERAIKPSIVLFLSVYNRNMNNQINRWKNRGRQILYEKINENWIVGIFNGMNLLWCDLWKYRSPDMLKLKKEQLGNIRKITEKYKEKYKDSIKSIKEEDKENFIKNIDIDDYESLDKLLCALCKLV